MPKQRFDFLKRVLEAARVVCINIGTIAGCLVFITLVIELHHWHKYSVKLPKNNFSTVTWGNEVKNNRYGFRERDFAYADMESQNFVVIVLGDSLTWGAGLAEKQRYSNVLEKNLQAAYPGAKVSVINFGKAGGPTTMERDILRSIYRHIRPDLVVVGFCVNDPQAKSQNYSIEREHYSSQIEPFLAALARLRMNGTAKLVAQVYENILIFTGMIPNWPDALDRAYQPDSREWQEFAKALKEISIMSREVTEHPPIFISLNQGTSMTAPTDYNRPDAILKRYYLRWYKIAESEASKQGFLVVNCENEFKQRLRNHVMAVVPGEDCHPSAEMNQVYAEKLFRVIQENKFIK